MLEECTMAHVYSLRQPWLKPCLSEAVQACPKVVAALRACGFAAAESALPGQTARVHVRSISVADVVLYKAGGNAIQVGQVVFHAKLVGTMLVGLSQWDTKDVATRWRKAIVDKNCSIFPSECMLQSVIFTPVGVKKKATVLVPAL